MTNTTISAAQRLVLISAVNNGGVVPRDANFPARQELMFLKLIGMVPEIEPEKLDRDLKAAWSDLAAAARRRDGKAARAAMETITNERYQREKQKCCITPAGRDLLQSGVVTVSIGARPRIVKKTA